MKVRNFFSEYWGKSLKLVSKNVLIFGLEPTQQLSDMLGMVQPHFHNNGMRWYGCHMNTT